MWGMQGERRPRFDMLTTCVQYGEIISLTSGRSGKTGSFAFNLCARTSFNDTEVPGVDAVLISSLAWSSHPVMSVFRASSPVPKSEFTAASESGCSCGFGRYRTERANASREKP